MAQSRPGSGEEIQDVKAAYIETGGSIGEIINYIPHSTIDDEPRLIVLVSNLVKKGELPALPAWESSIKDEKARLARKKQSQKEAKEAEDMAKELGVWDEFYGSGKAGQRKGKGKGKQTDDEDHSALRALMLRRKEKTMDGFFDNLAAKYAEPLSKKVGKRRQDKDVDMEGSPRKRSRGVDDISPPRLDDEEFEKLQKTFGDKVKPKTSEAATTRNTRARKAKTTK
jgi:DnaJ homolog subfamily C member 9